MLRAELSYYSWKAGPNRLGWGRPEFNATFSISFWNTGCQGHGPSRFGEYVIMAAPGCRTESGVTRPCPAASTSEYPKPHNDDHNPLDVCPLGRLGQARLRRLLGFGIHVFEKP